MNVSLVERRIKTYFEQEGPKGDLSSQEWEGVLSRVKEHRQKRWPWGPLTPFTVRPMLTAAASLVLAIVVGGISLWAAAPWEGTNGLTPTPGGYVASNGLHPAFTPEDLMQVSAVVVRGTPVSERIVERTVGEVDGQPVKHANMVVQVAVEEVFSGHAASTIEIAFETVPQGDGPRQITSGDTGHELAAGTGYVLYLVEAKEFKAQFGESGAVFYLTGGNQGAWTVSNGQALPQVAHLEPRTLEAIRADARAEEGS